MTLLKHWPSFGRCPHVNTHYACDVRETISSVDARYDYFDIVHVWTCAACGQLLKELPAGC